MIRTDSSIDQGSLTVFATGDIQLDPSRATPAASWVGPDLASLLREGDLTVGNLEAPLESDGDPLMKSGATIQTHHETASILRDHGFDAVSLANNHVMDYGEPGLGTTVDALNRCEVAHSGAGQDHGRAMKPAVVGVDDLDIAVLSFCEREFGIAGPETAGAAWISHSEIPLVVAACNEQYDLTVVMAHGGIMDIPIPPSQRQRQLRTLVEAGADVVVGHHPHVAQGYERYEGQPILYSLGDFAFDFSSDKRGRDWGLVAEIEFSGTDVVGIQFHPVGRRDQQPTLVGEDVEQTEYLEYLETLCSIIEDSNTLRRYWRRVASDKFVNHYSRRLANFFYGSIPRVLRHPATYRSLWEDERARDDVLWFLNRFRNESHRWLILTALSEAISETHEPTTEEGLSLDELLSRVDYSYHWSKRYL